MLLINALAIDMNWKIEFNKSHTYGRTFLDSNNNVQEVTTMNLTTEDKDIKYYKSDKLKSVSLPLKKYQNVNLEFIAIMPNENLTDYINTLSISDLSDIVKSLDSIKNNQELHLSIPKFDYNYQLDFMTDLQRLGIKEVFTENADLTKISNDNLYVSDAIHKADIKFSEEGVRAAAVSVITMEAGAAIEVKTIIDLEFDHPFIYLIKDKNSDYIWFIGSVFKPNLWSNDKKTYGY